MPTTTPIISEAPGQARHCAPRPVPIESAHDSRIRRDWLFVPRPRPRPSAPARVGALATVPTIDASRDAVRALEGARKTWTPPIGLSKGANGQKVKGASKGMWGRVGAPSQIERYRGGKFRGGIFPRGKFHISIWCGIFPVRNFVHVSHRTTVCLVLRRALPFVLFPLFCCCCQPTGKGGQEVE